jgi:O-antigen/teichoic acid export membrane protein
MNKPIKISGELLGRNTLFNFIGQVIPLLVGVVAIPFIVQGLGTERFGLLSLAWVTFGYFSIFDLGLGRATTKFVAEALGKGNEEQVPSVVWTTVTIQAILGIICAFVLAEITPLLVERILKVSSEFIDEAKITFYLLALSVPIVLISGSFRGVLEASQRFDLVNAVNIPISALTFILPLVGLLFGLNLPGIVVLILLAKVGALSSFLAFSLFLVPKLRKYSVSPFLFSRLFSFGGWVTVSSIVAPFLENIDRFIISALMSMTAVAYYSAPYEVVMRLRIIPTSLTMSLFPSFSILETTENKEKIGKLFIRSVKYISLILGVVALFINIFASTILQIWMGSDFALASTSVFQILSLGVLFNSLGYISAALLQGVNRPDLPAKLHLFELPIRISITYFLTKNYNIIGASWSWTLWAALDTFLLFGASVVIYFKKYIFSKQITWIFCVIMLFWWTLYMLKHQIGLLPQSVKAVISILVMISFTFFMWCYVLDDADRIGVSRSIKSLMNWQVHD